MIRNPVSTVLVRRYIPWSDYAGFTVYIKYTLMIASIAANITFNTYVQVRLE